MFPLSPCVYSSLRLISAAFGRNCWAEGNGLYAATAGKPAKFTVFIRDDMKQPVLGHNVQVSLKYPPDVAAGPTKVTTQDNGDGSYDVTYIPQAAGTAELMVRTSDGESIRTCPA